MEVVDGVWIVSEYLLDEEPLSFKIWFDSFPLLLPLIGIAAAVDSHDVSDLKAQESHANLANILNSKWALSYTILRLLSWCSISG